MPPQVRRKILRPSVVRFVAGSLGCTGMRLLPRAKGRMRNEKNNIGLNLLRDGQCDLVLGRTADTRVTPTKTALRQSFFDKPLVFFGVTFR